MTTEAEATNQSSSLFLQAAINIASAQNKGLAENWIAVLAQFAMMFGAEQTMYYQSDYRIDLLLRALEAESLRRVSLQELPFDLHFDTQGALSRYASLVEDDRKGAPR